MAGVDYILSSVVAQGFKLVSKTIFKDENGNYRYNGIWVKGQ